LLAFVVAAVALWRSFRVDRRQTENYIVRWTVAWPEAEWVLVKNHGPSTAYNVDVELWANDVPTTANSKRVRKGETVRVPASQISHQWVDPYTGPGAMPIGVVGYGILITSESRLGNPDTFAPGQQQFNTTIPSPPIEGPNIHTV
jgi:hypothetical protein